MIPQIRHMMCRNWSQMAKQEAESYTGVTLLSCTMEDGMARVIYQYS